jgi:catechol 2,3-dioxygenase
MITERASDPQSIWKPRRLGHGNLIVGDIARSMDFYINVCGLEEVFREAQINAGFVSNGNTHHDMGLVQPRQRDDVPQGWGMQSGLNHLAFEMENEEDLVDGWRRAHEAGVPINATRDHQNSHSIYLFDPDGNRIEIYADMIADWRAIFNATDGMITSAWSPGETPPTTERYYDLHPEIRRVEHAVFHPIRVTHAVLVAQDYEGMLGFYTKVVGLEMILQSPDRSFAVLTGTVPGRGDVALFRARTGRPAGLHHLGFDVGDEAELDASEERMRQAGVKPELQLEHETRRSIFVRDPDGIRMEFYVDRAPHNVLSDLEEGLALFLA